VISPAGEIIYSYTNPDYSRHTELTFEAVQKLSAQRK
jgi:hypothetical protein